LHRSRWLIPHRLERLDQDRLQNLDRDKIVPVGDLAYDLVRAGLDVRAGEAA